ncbi:MAG: hypothetical protein CMB64_07570 [Euryarchaeota archaeon]|nr:hypothetical protein [Euryarchaeota archaeon]|tara:strand:- start:3038 stop:3328 length:291 start_codon:yes stop_codon:yes gene_type:complete
MLKSEALPKKFIIPIIILVSIILLIPVGNVIANSNSSDSEEEKWNQTVIIGIFSLSVALGGILIYAIIENPPDYSENEEEESISFTEREAEIKSRK